MKRFIIVFLSVFALPALGSHIVGGEFELLHVSGYTYRLNLILYFDAQHGNPGANDPNVTVRIFRMRDNFRMRDVFLPRLSMTPVSYSQPLCSKGEIVTSRIYYTAEISLSPDLYNDAMGYYISWERCCRNYSITNVYSPDPSLGMGFAGQTFYLEFPPVVKGGAPLINSSPRLFPPLNDYACPGKPYYVDFAGMDDDGDSLVYTLVEPFNTHLAVAIPFDGPAPRPYPAIRWRSPYSMANIMGGNPDIRISRDGFVTVTPQLPGLFVFAVRCEEFRNGEKIGEVRRDFQMLVLNACPVASPPQITGKKRLDATFTYQDVMSVTFAHTVPNAERCIQVRVTDPDASKADDNFQEKIWIKAIPLNFKKDIRSILPPITSAVLVQGGNYVFDICFPECPFVNGPYQVGIVAYDDACSQPLFDTLKVNVLTEPPPNTSPYFLTPDVVASVSEGTSPSPWDIQVRDDEGDTLAVAVLPMGFVPSTVGMTYSLLEQGNGFVNAQWLWEPLCNVYDFTKKTDFDLTVIADDKDKCRFTPPVRMTMKFHIDLPNNSPPVIDTDLTPNPAETRVDNISKTVYETLAFQVTGKDRDNDLLKLGVQGKDFDVNKLHIEFPGASGFGSVTSPFVWNIDCSAPDLLQREYLEFWFIVSDTSNKCHFQYADTVSVVVKVIPPDNTVPELTMASLDPANPLDGQTWSGIINHPIQIMLRGHDVDLPLDPIRIDLIDSAGLVPPSGFVFSPVQGRGDIQTTFFWQPDCAIFKDAQFENNYTFTFRISDGRCLTPLSDTVSLLVNIRDIISDKSFLPPNFMSPNGDNLNDFFGAVRFDPFTHTLISVLPEDNCQGAFEYVGIYNRWGQLLFKSEDRDFKWYAEGVPTGVYFYVLKYTHREYRGALSVVY